MATPPMLRSRAPEPVATPPAPDALTSLTVLLLGLIALGLLIAAILAVYTYSTPAAELPLVVALALAFGLVLLINALGRAMRHLRAGR